MTTNVILFAEILVSALLAVATGLAVMVALRLRHPARRHTPDDFADETVLLFDGDTLVDASPLGRALLAHSPMASGTPRARLMAWIEPRFPGAGERLAGLANAGRMAIAGADGGGAPLVLTLELRGGLTRVVLTVPGTAAGPGTGTAVDRAVADELDLLRAVAAAAPLPVWQVDAEGRVVWANAAYLDQAARRLSGGHDLTWPLPALFEGRATRDSADRQRHRLDPVPGAAAAWFDVVAVPVTLGATRSTLHFALPVDAAVQAETTLRGFMQTLSRTFAHLPTGLAIFDSDRKLTLYNPALVDLTGLPPEFLSARPRLFEVLDAMRERSMLPEPRDWHAWRRRIAAMEAASVEGRYEETWSLPGGETYRVTGRPHPNGAMALMLDDISSEIGQTRRYRADLELGQAVIDAIDEAIAVFSASGTLVLSNLAYAALWGHDPGGSLDNDATVPALARHWRSMTAPSGLWDRAEAFAMALGPRQGWSDDARLADGRLLKVRFERLAGGATLAGFRLAGGITAAAEPADPVFASIRRSA